ncbi:MAG: hypothetical protein RLZZ142_1555 [Verrucomicrobiota bacterium]
MPEDFKKPTGFPSIETRMDSPTVSTSSVYQRLFSSCTGKVTTRPANSLVRSSFLEGSPAISRMSLRIVPSRSSTKVTPFKRTCARQMCP